MHSSFAPTLFHDFMFLLKEYTRFELVVFSSPLPPSHNTITSDSPVPPWSFFCISLLASGLGVGSIVGIVFAGIVLILLCIALLFWWRSHDCSLLRGPKPFSFIHVELNPPDRQASTLHRVSGLSGSDEGKTGTFKNDANACPIYASIGDHLDKGGKPPPSPTPSGLGPVPAPPGTSTTNSLVIWNLVASFLFVGVEFWLSRCDVTTRELEDRTKGNRHAAVKSVLMLRGTPLFCPPVQLDFHQLKWVYSYGTNPRIYYCLTVNHHTVRKPVTCLMWFK